LNKLKKAQDNAPAAPDSRRRGTSARSSQSAEAAPRAASGKSATRSVPAGKKAGPVPAGPSRVIFLVGFTGSGKSTVGRLLAIRMGNGFVDLEQEISQRAGMAISMIFNRYGEEGYRTLESAMLENVLQSEGGDALIVATGDGIVDSARNIEFMRQRGMVCFLHATYEEVVRRLGAEVPIRPVWYDKDALLRSFDLRAKSYTSAAHVMLETDHRDPSQIVLELAQRLEEHEKGKSRSRGSRRPRTS
jgi:shikimate kinase